MAIDPHSYPGPLEDVEKKNRLRKAGNASAAKNNIATVVVLFFVIGLGLFIYLASRYEGLFEDFSDWGFVSAIPFWLIIAIPIVANKKKNKKDVRTQVMAIAIMIAVMFAAFAGVAVFLLSNS